MDKGVDSALFVNDGSFMEKFKQLQQQKQEKLVAPLEPTSDIPCNSSGTLRPNTSTSKIALNFKTNDIRKSISSNSNGKLAFSLKQKSKLAVAPIKLGADEDEDEDEDDGNASKELPGRPSKQQKLGQADVSEPSSEQEDVGNYCLSTYLFISQAGREMIICNFFLL